MKNAAQDARYLFLEKCMPPSSSKKLFMMLALFLLTLGPIEAFAKKNTKQNLAFNTQWMKLNTVPYKGKQDDIHFIDPMHGWYGNGAGKIYSSEDGGKVWTEQLSQPGTFFRTIGFIDANNGFAGNIGTDYFPGVTDTSPLYRTKDGGKTWSVVSSLTGDTVKGLCAIDILQSRFVNAGKLDSRVIIHAGGRVGGPATLLRSLDAGETWKIIDMSPYTAMILDVKFFDAMNGVVFGASDANVEVSHARIIRTKDGGVTWNTAYESKRPFEITWKGSFPSQKVGYATVQSYNPDPAITQRYILKTMDGGRSWKEFPLVNDAKVREFGIGFYNENIGWVGTSASGYQTTDGGKTWAPVELGRAANKIRVLPTESGFVAYAIGVDVYKLQTNINK
jgi:photosystem II stability/assembly factor-like uncharacterized protein